jgi:cell wall assembly regulator SMI1
LIIEIYREFVRSKSVDDLWAKYEEWLTAHFPEGLQALNAGAAEHEIATLEATIGMNLPQDFRSWLKVHNGQTPDSVGLLWSNECLSTSRILNEWQVMKQLLDEGNFDCESKSDQPGAIKTDWWNPGWVPVTSDGAGNLQCLDLAPGMTGRAGQVIDFDHAAMNRCVLAAHFREWVEDYIKDISDREYVYSDDYGRLMPADEL